MIKIEQEMGVSCLIPSTENYNALFIFTGAFTVIDVHFVY